MLQRVGRGIGHNHDRALVVFGVLNVIHIENLVPDHDLDFGAGAAPKGTLNCVHKGVTFHGTDPFELGFDFGEVAHMFTNHDSLFRGLRPARRV
jgi:hypothetical protein